MHTYTQEKNKLYDDENGKNKNLQKLFKWLQNCRVRSHIYNIKIGRSRTTGKNQRTTGGIVPRSQSVLNGK